MMIPLPSEPSYRYSKLIKVIMLEDRDWEMGGVERQGSMGLEIEFFQL